MTPILALTPLHPPFRASFLEKTVGLVARTIISTGSTTQRRVSTCLFLLALANRKRLVEFVVTLASRAKAADTEAAKENDGLNNPTLQIFTVILFYSVYLRH